MAESSVKTEHPAELTKERWRVAHHSYMYDDAVVDIAQMRKDAEARLVDRRGKEDTIIHFHPYEENWGKCGGTRHEYYVVKEEKTDGS
jgi:hypothetical protein